MTDTAAATATTGEATATATSTAVNNGGQIGVSPAEGTVTPPAVNYEGFSDELKGYAQNKGWKNWQETVEG